MRHATLLFLLIVVLSVQPARAQTQEPAFTETAIPQTSIDSPVGGQALQGMVIIRGSSALEGYKSTSLAFAYAGDPTDTWFLIAESETAVPDGELAAWDTTTISDGNYDLRMVVFKTDGNQVITYVEGLRVRNYSPVETDTPAPPTATTTPLPPTPGEGAGSEISSAATATQTSTPVHPTPTPLPTNPAEVSQATITTTLGKGGLAALALFALLGSYRAGRAYLRRPAKTRKY